MPSPESRRYARSPEARLYRDAPRLTTAATKLFGTLAAAKSTAGIPPDSNRWSKERVIECIQDLYVKRALRKPVVRHYPRLVSAAERYFGNWLNALVAAGVLRERPRPHMKWSREKVIEAIRQWDQTCRESGPHPVSMLLRITAWRFFGGFPQAMRAAGLELGRRRMRAKATSR